MSLKTQRFYKENYKTLGKETEDTHACALLCAHRVKIPWTGTVRFHIVNIYKQPKIIYNLMQSLSK